VIPRPRILAWIRKALKRSRVVALIGPRQCGKTTLARQIVPADSDNYLDLETPVGLARVTVPMTQLSTLRGVVVIDEVQRRPELFPLLRVLADRGSLPARFLILGSATPALRGQASESLAGRLETLQVAGFSLAEVSAKASDRHWLRGAFPRAFLARSNADSLIWRQQFIGTFLERDVPQLGITIPATALLRFWTMLAHYHGEIWKAANPARSMGVTEPTVRRYLDLLTDLFMVRQLQPWHENLRKRQVKAPKIYLRDSGILHSLLGIRSMTDLLGHPKCGASWEGYAIEETLKLVIPDQAYFWATHQGAELDLLLFVGGRRIGIEVKRMDAPTLTRSMRVAMEDLRLDRLIVLYPGRVPYALADRVVVVPLQALAAGDPRELLERTGGARLRSSRVRHSGIATLPRRSGRRR
jgi:predicted AAA+ superfamily ATPase